MESRNHLKNGAIPKSHTSRGKINETKMKRLVFISGALAFSLIPLGVLFKLTLWPGAGALIIAGIGIFSIFFVPSLAKYLYDKEK
jgi:hypothetical protein